MAAKAENIILGNLARRLTGVGRGLGRPPHIATSSVPVLGSSWFPRAYDHTLPQERVASRPTKLWRDESRLGEKAANCPPGPEFDVSAIPQRRPVPIHCSRRRQHQILQVPVIGRRQDQHASILQKPEGALRQIPRSIEVLHDLCRDDGIERTLAEMLYQL